MSQKEVLERTGTPFECSALASTLKGGRNEAQFTSSRLFTKGVNLARVR